MQKLKKELLVLKEEHSLVSVKGGTEVEAMTFEEIHFMRKVSDNIVPMTVKIGGPEARNDINFMLSIGVNRILAPMIESSYGLKNFVQTIEQANKNQPVELAINIETITAYNNMESMVRCPHFLSIDLISVGRSDLSSSMNKDVDDEKVFDVSKEIVEQSKFYKKKTSTGGKINPINAVCVRDKIKPDYINTRNMIVDCNTLNISDDIREALLWEKKFYECLKIKFHARKSFYLERISSIENRLNEKIMV